MSLEACVRLAQNLLPHAPTADGARNVGTAIIARAGADVLIVDDAYDWLRSTRDLFGEAGFVAAVMSPSVNLSALGRAVVRVRLNGDAAPSLLSYYASTRKGHEINAQKSKRGPRTAIETMNATKLAPGYGSKKGRRPGYSRVGMEQAA